MYEELLFIGPPKRMQAAVLAIGTLLLPSCAIGYDGSGTFSSGVSDSQLASPSADDITFTPNVSGTEVTITWPVVMGAGGYEVSFYNMNDPDNPVAVGDENEVIDGCSTTRAIAEDTQYEFRIARWKTLSTATSGQNRPPSPTMTPTLLPCAPSLRALTWLPISPTSPLQKYHPPKWPTNWKLAATTP